MNIAQTFVQNLRTLKLRYYFGFYNVVFSLGFIWLFFFNLRPFLPPQELNVNTVVAALILLIPNAVLFPWVKAFGANRAGKKGYKNFCTRNLIDYVQMAFASGKVAYRDTAEDVETNIVRVPLSQYSFMGPQYEVRNRVRHDSKRANAVGAWMFYLLVLPLFDIVLLFICWELSFVLGWFAMYSLLKEFRKLQSNQDSLER